MNLPVFPRTQITHPPAYKGKPKLYPIIYPHEPLMKAGFKQLKQMFPNTNEHDHVLKWAADNIKHNDLQSLYLRHYKQNPQIHTEDNKNKLGHINGMMDISSEMKNVKLDKNDTLESAFKKYDDAEHAWRQGSGSRYIEAEGKPVVDFGDGWGWFDLGKNICKKEGGAMGHCGNTGDSHDDDKILSLRKVVKVGDKTYHEPALTFINNKGWLGEMKGRANSKPAESYHKRIVELMKHPDIKGMVGAGYMPENNFHFDDLSQEHKNQVRVSNPNFVDLRSDDWDEKQKIFASDSVPKIEKYQHTVKDIFQGKRLKEGLDSGKLNIDDLGVNDLRLLTKHRLFQKNHLLELITEQDSFKDGRSRAHALMAAKNSKHLDDEVISHWVNRNASSAAQVLGNKLNAQHIDTIVQNNPDAAAEYLKNHKDFNAQHIQTIAENNPYSAVKHLKDHPLFNAQHIDTIVQNAPRAAAEYLKDHPLLNAQHIQTIAEKDPDAAAYYLKDHPIYKAKYGKVQKSLQKTQQLEKVLVSEPSEGVAKVAKYDGMRSHETLVSTSLVPHQRFGNVYVHHFASDDNTHARHLVSMYHDPHKDGVSVLHAAKQNEDEPMTVYTAATRPEFQGNKLNYLALREAVKAHGTLHSDVMQSKPAFKNWNRLKQESGFKVNLTKPYREASSDDASMLPHIAQYSKQAERSQDMEKAVTPEQQKENIKKQRELKNKEIIAKLKSKVVDKAPAKDPSTQPKLLMSEDDSPAGIPIYLKTHPSHDSLAGVHVHVDKLPSLENYGLLDEPRIDRALDSADSKGHKAVYVSADQIEESAKKPKLQLVKSLRKALWPSAPKVVNGQYAKPFSMGGTKKDKKPIQSHFGHPDHAKFNAQEHLDAYWRHQEKIKQNPKMESSLVNFHKQQAQQHWDKSKELVDAHDTSRQIKQ